LVQNGANGTGIINPINGTNVSAWDNEGYLTNNEGSSNFRGNGSTTTITVNHGMNSTPTVVTADATVSIAKKIGSIGSSSFDVVFCKRPTLGLIYVVLASFKTIRILVNLHFYLRGNCPCYN
jgi:hypothetical protein